MRSDGFEEFHCVRNFSMGLNLADVENFLNLANVEDALMITAQDNSDTATFTIESPNCLKV